MGEYLMHSQILVIYPAKNIDLEDVMYWYQEVDKTQEQKMADERCQFILGIPEKEIPKTLQKIKKELEKDTKKYLEMTQYRSTHTLKEFKQKYNQPFSEYMFHLYKSDYDALKEYETIKDLPHDDPEQIKFIKDYAVMVTDEFHYVYIKGVGYGSFHNPLQMWDYYEVVNEFRFAPHVTFLVNKNGEMDNTMLLNDLDVSKTVANIKKHTLVWEHIIFCQNKPSQSNLYTVDDIRFSKDWNRHCLVTDLEDVLVQIQEHFPDDDFMVIALDHHW